jgi:hypothetical protein
MEHIYDQAKEALRRYQSTEHDSRDVLGEQILETVDSHIEQVLNIWMGVFGEGFSDSKLFQGLYNRREIAARYTKEEGQEE